MTKISQEARQLLLKLGRASTPGVARNPYNIQLSKLVGGAAISADSDSVLVISADRSLENNLGNQGLTVVVGLAGCLEEQTSNPQVSHFIVDTASFEKGPWIGTANGSNHHLAFEIASAAQKMSKTGRLSILIERPSFTNSVEANYLKKFFSVCMPDYAKELTEEGADQTSIWNICLDSVSRR